MLAQDVFGIQRELPRNYVEREEVDSLFVESLSREKHIIVYGSSKQGKTCLRKHGLMHSDYITVHCSNKMDILSLNADILKQAGYRIVASDKKTITGKNKIIASMEGAFAFFGKAKVGAEAAEECSDEIQRVSLELDVEDVNDVISALNSIEFNKFIVLEDFHYLPDDVQNSFSVQLKAFHENSHLCFIVVGVWREENRLIVFNGDLAGRLISINADEWSEGSLLEVVQKGEQLLNIQFDDAFKENVVQCCFGNVSILQEACFEVCRDSNILSSPREMAIVGNGIDVKNIVTRIIDRQKGRYNAFLTHFANGFQKTDLEMYKWILYPVLCADIEELKRGLPYSRIRKEICEKHPQGRALNAGNVTQALQYVTSLQVKINVKPIVLDYDRTDLRLDVVDRSFLVWMEYVNRNELLDMVGLPVE